MATDAKLRAGPAKAEPKAETPKAPKAKAEPKVQVGVLKIKAPPEKPFRTGSARDVYWQRFLAYDGKPVAELEESCMKDPPSMPKKGKLAGRVEPFGGWLSYFKQGGMVSVVDK